MHGEERKFKVEAASSSQSPEARLRDGQEEEGLPPQ
jgi:hypothetical protein